MKTQRELTTDDYLADALSSVRKARVSLGSAQRELPGQSDDVLQRQLMALWGETYDLQQRISQFRRDVRNSKAVDNAG